MLGSVLVSQTGSYWVFLFFFFFFLLLPLLPLLLLLFFFFFFLRSKMGENKKCLIKGKQGWWETTAHRERSQNVSVRRARGGKSRDQPVVDQVPENSNQGITGVTAWTHSRPHLLGHTPGLHSSSLSPHSPLQGNRFKPHHLTPSSPIPGHSKFL